ncbi:MAG TPA: lipid-transfer protein, partial [Burkholderiales bacterium]|nr:lipid-transfer protein [Burkholderiales bacterium]
VICSESFLRKHGAGRAVRVVASGLTSDSDEQAHNVHTLELMERASRQAYERAGMAPEDVDVAETHDCFTVSEVISYEALGLCAKGEGGRLVDERATWIGGRIPVNPSGGLLARGHPLGATGVAQICELATQLRGEAGARQVEGAQIGLAANTGMWSCCVTLLAKAG